jgi:hypothetical protein
MSAKDPKISLPKNLDSSSSQKPDKTPETTSKEVVASDVIPNEDIQAPRSSVISLRQSFHIGNGKRGDKE